MLFIVKIPFSPLVSPQHSITVFENKNIDLRPIFVCTLAQFMIREIIERGSGKRKRLLQNIKDEKGMGRRVRVLGEGSEGGYNLPNVIYDMCGALAP